MHVHPPGQKFCCIVMMEFAFTIESGPTSDLFRHIRTLDACLCCMLTNHIYCADMGILFLVVSTCKFSLCKYYEMECILEQLQYSISLMHLLLYV